jgi:hypothetical protein
MPELKYLESFWRRASFWRRVSFGLALTILALGLAACEQPDFSGVRFKPQIRDPNGYKTAVKAYLYFRHAPRVVWGNEFLYHSNATPEQELTPLAGVEFLFDESQVVKTDHTGQITAEGLSQGYHTLRFTYAGHTHSLAFQMKRNFVTLLVMELVTKTQFLTSQSNMAHTFVTVPYLRRLLAFHRQIDRVLAIYEDAQHGKRVQQWERLLAADYSDDDGGREDLLRALQVSGRATSDTHIVGRHAELSEKEASVTVRLENDGAPDFMRFDLKRIESGSWRVNRIRY